ncbi:hypothetical protein B0H17DRAFT_1334375 [Mycena rosella]|uniref:Uncharacterized protein n=1 Tax=Mycena rosella TaxID=1033263 RepID=A0AAD7D3K5_MYCRO|nr:hypothetical protein B0H17DRAFT_1334375 [Mycena rosella]
MKRKRKSRLADRGPSPDPSSNSKSNGQDDAGGALVPGLGPGPSLGTRMTSGEEDEHTSPASPASSHEGASDASDGPPRKRRVYRKQESEKDVDESEVEDHSDLEIPPLSGTPAAETIYQDEESPSTDEEDTSDSFIDDAEADPGQDGDYVPPTSFHNLVLALAPAPALTASGDEDEYTPPTLPASSHEATSNASDGRPVNEGSGTPAAEETIYRGEESPSTDEEDSGSFIDDAEADPGQDEDTLTELNVLTGRQTPEENLAIFIRCVVALGSNPKQNALQGVRNDIDMQHDLSEQNIDYETKTWFKNHALARKRPYPPNFVLTIGADCFARATAYNAARHYIYNVYNKIARVQYSGKETLLDAMESVITQDEYLVKI